MSLLRILNEGLTNEKDEAELILYGIILSLLVGLGLSCYDVIGHGTKFEFTSFGVGVGSILGLGGGGYLLKRVGDKNGSDVTTTEVNIASSTPTT